MRILERLIQLEERVEQLEKEVAQLRGSQAEDRETPPAAPKKRGRPKKQAE